jgi:electron transport complex protein RnfC
LSAATYDLGKLHGGLRLQANKQQSTRLPILDAPVPAMLVLPLSQHTGTAAEPIVKVGQHVLGGEMVASHRGPLGAAVHASSSGTVIAIEPRPVSRQGGDEMRCIVIETDGNDQFVEPSRNQAERVTLEPQQFLQKLRDGGIVGLGGAVFPTAEKILQARSGSLDHLILNGVECEPYISCDDMLMQERAIDIVGGAQLLLQALEISNCIIAVESDKPKASRKLAEAIEASGDERLLLKQVPTVYPSGAEDQLVQLLTGREVPAGGLPGDVGCIVQNVATAAAIERWIRHGEALTRRITTISGDGVNSPVNVRARLGTAIADLIPCAGGYSERAKLLVIGGAMTGKCISTDAAPLVKATNCILVMSRPVATADEMPCIRCGECAEVCPVQLLPQQLHWYDVAEDEQQLRKHGLIDCIECGCCDLVCPSHIPLTALFRRAKLTINELENERARAERAQQRFEARSSRLLREEQQREHDLAAQKDVARNVGADAIRAILERSQQKDTTRNGKEKN